MLESDNAEFLGNAVRTLPTCREHDVHVRKLLAPLIADDTRPACIEWARHRLMPPFP
jgi:hypothetical protein